LILSSFAVNRSFEEEHRMSARSFRRIVCVLTLVAASCGDSENPIGPSNQPEITNNRDSFQFQASNLSRTTQTLSYTWENTGTSANVSQSGQISSGTATLTIRQPSGAEVYSRDLSMTGTFATSAGSPGNWRIEVRLDNVTGTLNFRVQKP
jgi:hypothetical protein